MATNEEMREHMADWPNSAAAAGRGEPGEGGREGGREGKMIGLVLRSPLCATRASGQEESKARSMAAATTAEQATQFRAAIYFGTVCD